MEEKIRELENELDGVKKALRESESENVQLKDQLKDMTKGEEKLQMQMKALQENLETISTKHKELENAKENTSYRIQEYEEKISELESRLRESTMVESELEAERENLTGRVAEHERQAKATHEASVELRGLMLSSHSRVEDSNRRVGDFDKLLEAEKTRINELEHEIEAMEEKCGRAEAEKKRYSDLVSELTAELEKTNLEVSTLESALEGAAQMEKELRESLKNNKLNVTQGKLESSGDDFKAAGIREGETAEKLKSAEVEELESANENLVRDSAQELKGLARSFSKKDIDMNSLYADLEFLKDQIKDYKDQTAEAAGKSVALKEELDRTSEKLGLLEALNEELKKLREEAEDKAAQSVMENELLVETNSNLKDKVYKLQQQLETGGAENAELSAALAERDDAVQQLNSVKQTIEDLTRELASKREKFQSELSSIMEQKQQLVDKNVASQNELQVLLTKLEGQVNEYRVVNETLKDELEKLSLEAAQNSARGTRAQELEHKLKVAEADMKKEVESVRASAAAREADLTARLEQHMQKARDDDAASEKAKQFEQDSASAQYTITQLKEENDKLVSALETISKHASEELEAKSQEVILLEKQVKELQQKLQEDESDKSKDDASMRSRDTGSSTSPTKKKSKMSGSPSSETQAKTVSHTSFALVFGVALGSIIIGLVLGNKLPILD